MACTTSSPRDDSRLHGHSTSVVVAGLLLAAAILTPQSALAAEGDGSSSVALAAIAIVVAIVGTVLAIVAHGALLALLRQTIALAERAAKTESAIGQLSERAHGRLDTLQEAVRTAPSRAEIQTLREALEETTAAHRAQLAAELAQVRAHDERQDERLDQVATEQARLTQLLERVQLDVNHVQTDVAAVRRDVSRILELLGATR